MDQKAFTVEKDGDTITAVNYQGDNKQLVRHLGAEEKIEISISGERVFNGPAGSSQDFFAALIELREALSSDDAEGLNSSMEKIDGCRDRIIGFRMEAGTRGQHLENSIRSMKSLKVKLEGDLGDLRGADITEVLMNLALQEVAYRASIQMASRLGSLDILEIFR